MWGGTGNDHVYGSYGEDHLDILPRHSDPGFPADPASWFVVAPAADSLQGLDIIYGGWNRDEMQADEGGPGPVVGDRLLDWVGTYNLYYTCPGAYGDGVITRFLPPDIQVYMIDQATGDGAVDVGVTNSSGFRELGFVYQQDAQQNAGSPYPGTPGHFVCSAQSLK